MPASSGFFVVSDITVLPSRRYSAQMLDRADALRRLKEAVWYWYAPDEQVEVQHCLVALARDAGLKLDGDSLEQRRIDSPARLMAGDRYLVIHDTNQKDTNNQAILTFTMFEVTG